jgi:hypothetical protein
MHCPFYSSVQCIILYLHMMRYLHSLHLSMRKFVMHSSVLHESGRKYRKVHLADLYINTFQWLSVPYVEVDLSIMKNSIDTSLYISV